MDLIVNTIFILAILTLPFKIVVETARFFGARDALKSRKNKNDYRREEFEEKPFVTAQNSVADDELYELVEEINNLKKRVKWLTALVVILSIVVILF